MADAIYLIEIGGQEGFRLDHDRRTIPALD